MLTRRLPDGPRMEALVEAESRAGFTYAVGLTDGPRPRWWFVEDIDAILGVGPDAFAAACDALRRWEHVGLDWFRVHRPDATPLEADTVVAYSARALGVWWSYCCRIVRVVDETAADGTRRFGYVYGTVGRHAERGEERVVVTLDAASGEVHGSILAVSRPARWFSVAGLPFVRHVQKRFKPEALAAWAGAVRRRLTANG